MKRVNKSVFVLIAEMTFVVSGCESLSGRLHMYEKSKLILQMSPTELKNCSTYDLIYASGGNRSRIAGHLSPGDTWAFDDEIDRELVTRQKEDILWLIQNATGLEQFESNPYSEKSTQASRIRDKYEGIPSGVYVEKDDLLSRMFPSRGEFTLVPAKWISQNEFDDARRKWYVKNHPELSNEIKESILSSESSFHHKLRRGMTAEQVIAAIGYPNDINSSTGSWGVHEQWIYGGLIWGHYVSPRYFYFENGRLTSWQN